MRRFGGLILRSRLALVLLVASAAATAPATAQSSLVPEDFVMQVPSTDGFVHIRLSPDLGDGLDAVKAQLEQIPNARIGDPADYELTTLRDFPQTLLAVDQHQAEMDWVQGYDQELLEEHPYDFESHPRTIILGNLLSDDYASPLREMIAKAAVAKMLIALGQRGAANEVEICVDPDPDEAAAGEVLSSRCHSGVYREPPSEVDRSPDDIDHYGSKILLRDRSNRPKYVALFLIDGAFETHRLIFPGQRKLAYITPGASAEVPSPFLPDALEWPKGRYRLVVISSDEAFDPDALPATIAPPQFSASFAEYRNVEMAIGALGGGAPALPGMAAFIAQFYSTVKYDAADIAKDVDKVNERGVREASHRCGASLIAPNLAVTAAHCVAKYPFTGDGLSLVSKRRRVRIDSPHLGTDGTTYGISGVAVPAEYDPYCGATAVNQAPVPPPHCSVARSQAHDIALLLLKPDRGTDDRQIHTVSIARAAPAPGSTLRTYGWGYTGVASVFAPRDFDENNELQRSPFDLQYGNVDALDRGSCNKRMREEVPERTICTVRPRGLAHNVFTCIGDSGGPLVRIIGKREELVGITSWSKGCGYKDYPDVFTDVTKYRGWIEVARKELKPDAAIRVPLPKPAASASARR